MSLKKSIDNSSTSKNPLKTIRENIDRIDNKIHDLLIERAEITGKLVLSEFTKNALSKFKK